ncbi:hypothetical protein [Plantactinospora sp. KLBMP9567]|uniref:hypothetical protein n=1 Tax=Plantactinospora sp. KLBMP9567 TaxID=3085900 RepID=UPI002980E7A5|nr:hypothetical protein [Plantactinospora sp. KLBMP9567]MDW5330517.1 hypothetical protein [Plantactinospora sp. KLBMP9567]
MLIVAHTIASCHRLLDVVELLEEDPRIQTVFTVPPDAFNRGVARHLHRIGALVLPWPQAVREEFDLALTAAYGGLADLHAPVLVMAHGAGHGKTTRPSGRRGPALATAPVYGLDPQRLTRNGEVLPSAIALSHEHELDILRRQCPEAVPVAVVAGDPCFDRLVASLPERGRYRRALGVDDDQELVVVSSTWGRTGLFGNRPDLLPLVMDQLPRERFRVAALLHPAVWCAHGHRQVRAWLRSCREAGLILPGPEDDWRSVVVAADHVIGDHGSVTTYAAALGRKVLHLAPGLSAVTAGSAQETVIGAAERLDPRRPVPDQLRSVRPVDQAAVVARLTSRPGRAGTLLRQTMYRLLRLDEPGRHRQPAPVPEPRVRSERSS